MEVAVVAQDRYDNLVTAEAITATWEGSDGDDRVPTNEDGIARFELFIERPEEVLLTISTESGVELEIPVPAAEPPTPVSLTIGSLDCLTAPTIPDFEIGGRYQIPIAVCDSVGQRIPDVQISVAAFAAGPGASIIEVEELKADMAGEVAVWLIAGTFAGSHWLEAVTKDGLAAHRIDFEISPGDPAYLDIVSGNNQISAAGQSVTRPFMVRLTDRYDNPIAGETIEWTATNGTVRDRRDSGAAVSFEATTTRFGRSRAWGFPASADPAPTFVAAVGELVASFEVDVRSIALVAERPVTSLPAVQGALTLSTDYYGDVPPVALIDGVDDDAITVSEGEYSGQWTVCFSEGSPVGGLGQFELTFQLGEHTSNPITIGFGQIGAMCSEMRGPRGYCEDYLEKSCLEGRCESDDWAVVSAGGETFTMGSDDPLLR